MYLDGTTVFHYPFGYAHDLFYNRQTIIEYISFLNIFTCSY